MEENMTQSVEAMDGDELFLDPADFGGGEGEDQHIDEPTEPTEPVEDGTDTQPTEEGEGDDGQGTPTEGNEEAKYHLKWPDGEGDFTLEEVLKFAGKGKDSERVTQQRDSLRNALQEQTQWRAQNESVLSDLETVAKAANQSVDEFVRSLRVNLLMKQNGGMSRGEATERVLREDAEKKLSAKEQGDLKAKEASMRQTRAQREFEAFQAKYKDVDVRSLPQEVIDRAASGEVTLSGAYAEHLNSQLNAEIKKLQAELAAEKQNKANKQKTAGSARTEGASSKVDDFLAGFDSV